MGFKHLRLEQVAVMLSVLIPVLDPAPRAWTSRPTPVGDPSRDNDLIHAGVVALSLQVSSFAVSSFALMRTLGLGVPAWAVLAVGGGASIGWVVRCRAARGAAPGCLTQRNCRVGAVSDLAWTAHRVAPLLQVAAALSVASALTAAGQRVKEALANPLCGFCRGVEIPVGAWVDRPRDRFCRAFQRVR